LPKTKPGLFLPTASAAQIQIKLNHDNVLSLNWMYQIRFSVTACLRQIHVLFIRLFCVLPVRHRRLASPELLFDAVTHVCDSYAKGMNFGF
jgi:hypothetical protein